MPDAEHDGGGGKIAEAREQRIRRGIRSQVVNELNFRFDGELRLHQLSGLPGSDQRAGKKVVRLHLKPAEPLRALLRPVDAFRRQWARHIVTLPMHYIDGNAMSE